MNAFKADSIKDLENLALRRKKNGGDTSYFKLQARLDSYFLISLVGMFLFGILLGMTLPAINQNSASKKPRYDDYRPQIASKNEKVILSTWPEGYNPINHTIQNRLMNQHLFLNILRPMTEAHRGNVPVFRHPSAKIEEVYNITPGQFLREYVLRSRPLVIKSHSRDWKAYADWQSDQYLLKKVGDVKTSVEMSQTNLFSGEMGKNKKKIITMKAFLKNYLKLDRKWNYYLAEMNILNYGNLHHDVPDKPPLMSSGHYQHHVTQIWIGAGGQITPTHRDHFENMLCQIVGTRDALIYDPFQIDLLYKDSSTNVYSLVDPDKPDLQKYPLFKYAVPVKAHLEPGDCLYMPANWMHLVKSGNSRNIAVNYWMQQISPVGMIAWKIIDKTYFWGGENIVKGREIGE